MTNPTRQEMLDSITHKIARTWWSTWPWETGYFLPVMIGDVLDWMDFWFIEQKYLTESVSNILIRWKTKRESLDKQSDDCITYIFNKLPHD